MSADRQWLTLFPDQASEYAARVDALFLIETGVIALVVGGVLALLVWFAVRFRAERRVERGPRPRGRRSRRWEIIWTAVPLLIFLALFAQGARLYVELGQPPQDRDALHIYGVAKQWMWKFQHPDGQREINELHVPVGRGIRVTLISQDVIHSFFLPAFRVKQDALPGRYTETWFEPARTGTFHLFCAEFCGTAHARMRGRVVVLEPEAYAAWLQRQPADDSLVRSGARLFRRLGCSGCHDPGSAVHAPPLAGLFGRSVPLADGSRREVDASYLRDSILLPMKDVVAGYEPIMPSFKGQVSEAELVRLIAYLKQLEETPP